MIEAPPRTPVSVNAVANGWRLLLRAVRDLRPVFALRSLALLTLGVLCAPAFALFLLLGIFVALPCRLVAHGFDAAVVALERYGDSVGYALFLKLRLSSERFAEWVSRQVVYDARRDCRVWRPLFEGDKAEEER